MSFSLTVSSHVFFIDCFSITSDDYEIQHWSSVLKVAANRNIFVNFYFIFRKLRIQSIYILIYLRKFYKYTVIYRLNANYKYRYLFKYELVQMCLYDLCRYDMYIYHLRRHPVYLIFSEYLDIWPDKWYSV